VKSREKAGLPCRRDALDVELCDPDWRQPPVGHEAFALLPERPRRGQIAALNVEKTLDADDAAGFLAFETGRSKAGNPTSYQCTCMPGGAQGHVNPEWCALTRIRWWHDERARG
jgi:hypothetical protein